MRRAVRWEESGALLRCVTREGREVARLVAVGVDAWAATARDGAVSITRRGGWSDIVAFLKDAAPEAAAKLGAA